MRAPYKCYEKTISQLIKPNYKVLEICSGSGRYTYPLLKTGSTVMATDISKNSLELLVNRLRSSGFQNKLTTKVADIENLPFGNDSFDVLTSAGSLSYGSSEIVDKEIFRVIKNGGYFICVDSLNENPIYKFNRYINYLLKKRTKMTFDNMPTNNRINKLRNMYSDIKVQYFGSISFLGPFFSLFIGSNRFERLSNSIDAKFQIQKLSFKFLLVAKK
mgnify:CR=1 FL=1